MWKTDYEDKPTGKQLFLMNRSAFDDITLDEEDVEEALVDKSATKGAAAAQNDEETKVEGDGEEEEAAFVYDRALYDADGLDDEDVDFDEDD